MQLSTAHEVAVSLVGDYTPARNMKTGELLRAGQHRVLANGLPTDSYTG